MIQYSDSELEALLDDLESELAERKESWKGDTPDKACQAVCAFANDLPGHNKPGVLFIGVRDNGTPSGLPVSDDLLQTLADIKTAGNILPPPTISVNKRKLKGTDVAVVTVSPSDAPPVCYKGRIWIRTGPRRAIATAQDERILNEKRRYRDIPFDIQPVPSSTLKDIDRLLFEQEYLPSAFAPDILAANGRSYEQKLAACKMISREEEPVPTILGLLVLGNNPREFIPSFYIQFLRIDGEKLSDPVSDEKVIDGPLLRILSGIDDKLSAHNRTGVDFISGAQEKRSSDYPMPALQQILRNAIMHRTYENTNSPVRVYWFNDRIEIFSPGGPFGIVTEKNFEMPGYTDYRNPNLAEAMKILGFVQKFGMGIQIAKAELEKNGNPALEYKIEPENILCTIRKRP